MLDKQTESMLKVLSKYGADAGYKVLEFSDLIDELPRKYSFDEDSIKMCATWLANREYIEIKYMENNVICLRVLPKSKMYFENQIESDRESKLFRRMFIASIVTSAVVSFLAVMLASFLFR